MSVRRPASFFGLLPIILALAACTGPSHYHTAVRPIEKAKLTTNDIPVLTDDQIEDRADTLAHFATGLSHEFNDQNGPAIDEYWKAAISDPSNEELVLDLSRRLLREKQTDKAVELLKKAARLPGSGSSANAWLGLAYIQAGQTNLAIEANRLSIKIDPLNLLPYQNLSQIYEQRGATNEAIKIINQAATQSKAAPEFYLGLSESYMRFARDQALPDKAAREKIISLLDHAAKGPSDDPLLIQRLGDLYFLFGEPLKAEPFYSRLLKDYPEAPGVRERLANIYLKNNQKEKAAEMIEGLRRANPTDPSAYYLLGSLAFEGKELEKANDYFQTALKLNPDFEPIYYDLAGLKISSHQPAEALAVLDKARAKFKLSFVLEFYTGIAQSMLEKYTEALSHLTSAELIAKTSEPERLDLIFYHQLGATYERSGNIPDAEKAFKKCLQLAPNDAETLNYLGYMWAERGEHLDEARAMIEKAVNLDPDNAAFLDSLGWVLFKQNKPGEAVSFMEKAVSLSEKADATLYEHLGDIEARLKHFEKARDAWNKSLQVEPNEKIRKKLESLNISSSSAR